MDMEKLFAFAFVITLVAGSSIVCSHVFYEYGYSHGYNDNVYCRACDSNLDMCYSDLDKFNRDIIILSQQLDSCKCEVAGVDSPIMFYS
jgi:hypothetical protein